MEEYYKYSDQLLANLLQNIGKCTSETNQKLTNISKFTGDLLPIY